MATPIKKEQLIARIETQKETALKHPECSVALMDLEIANIARAAMDAEPVYQWRERYEEGSLWEDCTKEQHDGFAKNPECEARVLYTAPPAPVLQEDIPGSVYEILCQACGGKAWMYEAALWDACRDEILKNSASAKPSTDAGCVTNNPSNCASVKSSTDAGCVTNTRSNCASVKDHQIRELVNELRDIAIEYHGTQQLRERIARTVRAAMLNHSENERDMVEPVSQAYKLPATRFQQVADLYGILVPGGRTTTYSTDAAEASDCRVMGWSVQEYVKLERLQDALTGNSPVIPDRLNVRAVAALREAVRNQWLKSEDFADKVYWKSMHDIANEIVSAMLAAAPQQEGSESTAQDEIVRG